jgi:Domain of Unknown Function with PDB structure (DUF3857)/Transglutaminase-like superfamily
MKLHFILLMGLYGQMALAGDIKYPISEIPEDLKTGMYAVIREQKQEYEILERSKARYKYRLVITILNEKAKDLAVFFVGYDKDTQIDYIDALVYDETGKQIKKLKNNEILDRSSISGYSLFEDNRVKIANLSAETFPYTIEFEYQTYRKVLYSIPGFELYFDDEVSSQRLEYKITYPLSLVPRYKLFKVNEPIKAMVGKDKEQLTWDFTNVRPEKFEKMAPPSNRTVPNIAFAPSNFEFSGYAGSMASWKELGQWQILLNQGRDQLSPETRSKVKALTADAKTDQEKIKILYQYMQSKTRYVSIQLGIGGFQPFEAVTVDQLGYGDCKALSNYMVALLKEVGIKGYYSWVYGGENMKHISSDFPIDYFNHIIVAVPQKKDTIWLECTSQTAPFGYLGDFTANRYALMVTDEGGKLVKTPRYKAEQNKQITTAEVDISMTGEATAKMKVMYSGLQSENQGLDRIIAANQADEQRKWLEKSIDIPSFNVRSFEMSQSGDIIPQATVTANLELRKYATISGKRMFLTTNAFNKYAYVPEKAETRRSPVVRRMAYVDTDTIAYSIPEQFYPEHVPPPIKINSVYGEYEATFIVDKNKLIYTRRLKMNDGEFPAETYPQLVDFFKNLTKADNTKIVFVNKT